MTRVSSHHKDHSTLHRELIEAKKKVKVGGIYSHFKYPENTCKVIAIGIREVTDTLAVIYQATYNPELIFIRDLESWLETPEVNGEKVPRFQLIR